MIPFWLLCDSLNRERREEPNGDEKKVEAPKTRNSRTTARATSAS